MLSGFVFDIKNMPPVLQGITYLKGSAIGVLWPQAAALVAITVILLGIAARRFRIKIG